MDYHDMLAYLGVSSAHPGGFAATVNFFAHYPIPPGSRVLEVGCGTGKTSCFLAAGGCEVIGLDIRPHMLEKAKQRAKKQGVAVDWIEGNIRSLPFESNRFDVVLAESVTVFADILSTLKEYQRVLVPGGKLYDREMMAMKPPPQEMKQAIEDVYGARGMPSLEEWLAFMHRAGFQGAEVWGATALSDDVFQYINMEENELIPSLIPSSNTPEVEKIRDQNLHVMTQYEKYHGYGVFIGRKS